jgi:hypothetical protein
MLRRVALVKTNFSEERRASIIRMTKIRSYRALTGWALRRNVSPVMYEQGFYILEDCILHSNRRENPHILHLLIEFTLYSVCVVCPLLFV